MDLFQGLETLQKSSFPKKCSTCGRVFNTLKDFVLYSNSISNKSGLKESYDNDNKPIVELFRNCRCGSTLMDIFTNRRDLSEKGLKKREIFGKLMLILEENGMSTAEAREELLKLIKVKG